jgi:hypothetical protein
MNKRKGINEIVSLLCVSLRHEIGSKLIVNKEQALKYAKDANILFNNATKTVKKYNFNSKDKKELKEKLENKLFNELKSKDFINDQKYYLMEDEIVKVLKRLKLI